MEKSGPSRWNPRTGKITRISILIHNHFYTAWVIRGCRVQWCHDRDNVGRSELGGTYCPIDDIGFDHRLIPLNVHHQRVRIEVIGGLSETVCATGMVFSSHHGRPAKAFNSLANTLIVRGDKDTIY